MKIWQAILLSILLITMPALSACDLLGNSREQQEYYRQQLETYKKVQEANRQAREAYNERLQQGLQEWAKAYREWQQLQQQQQRQQLQQLEGMPTDNQS